MPAAQLTRSATDMLYRAKVNGLNQEGYNDLISAAARSPFFAGELNAAADKGVQFSVGKPGGGTFFNGKSIVIDPTWFPDGSKGERPNVFATTIAHELCHATQAGGYGYYVENTPRSPVNPAQAALSGGTNEGTALVCEYVVAKQLGSDMHSGSAIAFQLDSLSSGLNFDLKSIDFRTENSFTSLGSNAVNLAVNWSLDNLRPGIAHWLIHKSDVNKISPKKVFTFNDLQKGL